MECISFNPPQCVLARSSMQAVFGHPSSFCKRLTFLPSQNTSWLAETAARRTWPIFYAYYLSRLRSQSPTTHGKLLVLAVTLSSQLNLAFDRPMNCHHAYRVSELGGCFIASSFPLYELACLRMASSITSQSLEGLIHCNPPSEMAPTSYLAFFLSPFAQAIRAHLAQIHCSVRHVPVKYPACNFLHP